TDELSAFAFGSDDDELDDDESAVAFESPDSASGLETEDSFFGLDEESDGEPETSTIVAEDDSENEFVLSLDTEDVDELSEFAFGSDDDELDDDTEELESEDSFFGLDDEVASEPETSATVDEDDSEDEFALSLDDEGTGDDELSEFAFGSDDDELDDDTEELESEDSFFGLDEESASEPETSAVVDEDDSEDELTLSLDTEDVDELSEFAFGSDDDELDDDESAVAFESPDSASELESEDSFFGLEEEAEDEYEELVLTLDDEEDQASGLGFEDLEEDDVDLNLDADLLETGEQEAKITLDRIAEISSEANAFAAMIPDGKSDFLLDQEYEVEEQRKNKNLLAEDAVEEDSEKIVAPEAISFLENKDEEISLRDDEDTDSFEADETEEVAPLFDVAPFVAAAVTISSDPSLDNIRSVNELAGMAKRSGGTPQQIMILHLLESATALIGQKSEPDTDDQIMIQELAAGLELAADDPLELTALVHHYTAWQQDFFGSIMAQKEVPPVQQMVPSSPVIPDCISNQDAVHQVQEGFSQLREAMMEEFNQLRKELHKG
ncbi:MAG: hypothetical protein WBM35_11850, partial [Candidatus Electrothrix sp.]